MRDSAAAGKLQWGRSVNAAETRITGGSGSGHRRRFNGAAALTLRKQGAEFSEFDILQGFNGAAALTLRKRVGRAVGFGLLTAASMGPQR